jgi:uncharacterized protein
MVNLNRALQVFVWAFLLIAQPVRAQALQELLHAVEEGNVKRTLFYLDRGLDPNSCNADGTTILMIASRLGNAELASTLIARKASLTRQTRSGDTALMMASLGGHLDMVKLLVDAGAPVEMGNGWQAIHYAAFSGSSEIVRFLLEHGADKAAIAPNSYTPLMLAVRNSHTEAARLLLLEKPQLEQRGLDGETALTIAQRLGDSSMVELLKDAGATQ